MLVEKQARGSLTYQFFAQSSTVLAINKRNVTDVQKL